MRKLFLCAAVLACGVAHAAGDAAYPDELQARARALNLAESVAWQRLMHYQPDRFGGGVTSTINFAGFFASPEGRVSPAAELDATLALFFSNELRYEEPTQCRYKARYEWLKSQLQFDPARLPPQACARYATWAAGINAESLALVFASSDLNSPASMFGHTLLRVDPPGADQRLLSYALNYAAEDIQDGGLTFAYRGITGGYTGYFSVYPYYEKVREYERSEHRDLWEYRLHLSPEDTQRVLRHMWELRGVGSPYYFFSQNCSFQLLSLIEAARPDLDLTHRFLYRGLPYAIPLDTLRQLRDAGMLDEPVYRPAAGKQFRNKLLQLPEDQRSWVKDYAAGRSGFDAAVFSQADDPARARLLETAHEQIYFLFQQGDLSREAGLPRDRAVLLERSRTTADADFAPVPRPATTPDHGHPSGRLSVGARADEDGAALVLRVRPSYHDRLDPPAGFMAGGEIEFFDIALLADRDTAHLDSLRIVSVQAVSPRDPAFRPWSWLASTGLRRLDPASASADPRGHIGGYADGGGGLAWSPLEDSQFYGFGFASVDVNPDAARGYRVRAGARVGFARQWSSRFTQQLEIDDLAGLTPEAEALHEVRLGTQWQVAPAHGLRLNLRHSDNGETLVYGGELLWQYYF